jgi:hypothetical protein
MTSSAIICFDNVTKRFGDLVVVGSVQIRGGAGGESHPDRPLRIGQVDCAAYPDDSGTLSRGHAYNCECSLSSAKRARGLPSQRSAPPANPDERRHGVPEIQSLSAYDGAAQRRRGSDGGVTPQTNRSGVAGDRALAPRRAYRQEGSFPEPTFRRPAAAGSDRSGPRHAAARASFRRADVSARSATRWRILGVIR